MIRVLVVEDELPLLRGIQIMVERIHPAFSVVKCALNGKEAIEYLEENTVDVIFTDINMPLLDGMDLMKHVYERYQDVILVVISGYSDFTYAQQAIEYRVKRYLLKPISQEEMKLLLSEIKREYDLKKQKKQQNKLIEVLSSKEDYIIQEGIRRKSDGNEELMQKIELYIREHLTEQISTKDLADKFGLSSAYLGKIFKHYTGYTPIQYLQLLRIEYAKCLLSINKELVAKEVAELVGYSDSVYFSKLFKKKVGVWPSQYKMQ